MQESKCQAGQIELPLEGYYQYWNYAEKKGYSGTAIFTKHKPLSVHYGVGSEESESEGRIITLEYEDFYLVNVYTPNSQRDLARLPRRLEWEDKLLDYIKQLDLVKPVIYCGDLNVAFEEKDLKNAKANIGNSGFTYEERGKLETLFNAGFTDTFRYLNPDANDKFTWWSYMNKVRERNIGWRIDYFIISNRIVNQIEDVDIHSHVMGSDHCPILLKLK